MYKCWVKWLKRKAMKDKMNEQVNAEGHIIMPITLISKTS